ncbi:hypothetical protein ACYBSK_33120 [Streptomyces sp. BYX5S]
MRRVGTVRGVLSAVAVVGLLGAGFCWRTVPGGDTARSEHAGAAWAGDLLDPAEPLAFLQRSPGERLLGRAAGLLRDTRSVRMAADVTRGAQHVRIDVRMDHEQNCEGSFDGGPAQRGHLIVLAGDEPEAYMRFSEASLGELQAMADSRGAAVAQQMRTRTAQMRGKYLKAPSGPKGAKALAALCTLSQQFGADEDVTGTKALKPVRRDGRRMIPLVPTADSGDEGIAYVDAGDKPYLRSLEASEDTMSVAIRFSEYGRPLTVRRPAAADVVEFEDGGSMFAV